MSFEGLLRQNDPRWGSHQLGKGTLTIGKAGCLLTCLVMAANRLRSESKTPLEADALCTAAGAFNGSLIVVPKAAEVLGLRAPDAARVRAKPGDLHLTATIRDTLQQDGLAIVHVDHDSKLPLGDPEGDHFVLAFRVVKPDIGPEHYECVDPAPGAVVWLDTTSCEGTSKWGKQFKQYKATGVIPVWRKP